MPPLPAGRASLCPIWSSDKKMERRAPGGPVPASLLHLLHPLSCTPSPRRAQVEAAELEAVERRLGGAPERLRTELKAHCLGLLNQTKAELMQARLAPSLPPSHHLYAGRLAPPKPCPAAPETWLRCRWR